MHLARTAPGLSKAQQLAACSRCSSLYQHSGRIRIVAHQKGNLADDLLDYVTAGPKMRKWYGQAERPDGQGPGEDEDQQEPRPEEQVEEGGSAVLVTDADTPMGEQVVLQLILARAEIKVLVRDTVAAKSAYGPYVNPISIDTSNQAMLRKALKGCGAVVCLGRPGALPAAAAEAGVHVLLLSAVGAPQGGFLGALFDRELSEWKDESREAQVVRSGCSHTIVRVSGVRDAPGGQATLQLVPVQGGPASPSQAVSREDLARVLVQALSQPLPSAVNFQVVSSSPGSSPEDLSGLFGALQQTA